MKITYVPETFPQVSETFVVNEIRWLVNQGHDVVVVPRRFGNEHAWNDDRASELRSRITIDVKIGPKATWALPSCLRRVGQLKPGKRPSALWKHCKKAFEATEHVQRILRHRSDVLVCHFGFDNAVAASLAGERLGVPVIQWLHGADLYTVPHRSRSWFTSRAEAIVTNSQYSFDLIRKLGITQRVIVAGLGVDQATFQVDEKVSKAIQPTLICVGRLGHNKNQLRLLRVFAKVVREIPEARLQIVGEGPNESVLREEAYLLGISGSVDFCGRLLRQDLARQMQQAWAFALLSDKEGLGVVFMEAQACGLPCVGPNVGGVPEVIDHEITGYLVDCHAKGSDEIAASRMVSILSDHSLRSSMAKAASQRAIREFDENHACQRVASVIGEAVRKKQQVKQKG